MTPLSFALGSPSPLHELLRNALDAERGQFEHRYFPDGESYIRIDTPVEGRSVFVCCTLDRPDAKYIPLHFLAQACREEGAASVGLIAPYLAYMRQDRRFKSGEAVASRHFAALIDSAFDWLVTVDPHLHRIRDLSDLYAIPSRTVHAAPLVSAWIQKAIVKPVLIGPDEESEQWVAAVAEAAGAPSTVLQKKRHGDRDVEVSVPEVSRWLDHEPILVDDIISTGRTMIQTIGHLKAAGLQPPTCIGVHAVFAGDAFESLQNAGAGRIVTANTIPHPSNAIDVSEPIAQAVRALL